MTTKNASLVKNALKPLGVVIPWFGKELKGGAEQQAWQIAERVAARGRPVEVLTTCCRSFLEDWAENHLPEGEERVGRLLIRRFPVDGRNRPLFDQLNLELMAFPRERFRPGVCPVDPGRARIWTDENINSSALLAYLEQEQERFQAFLFLPYLYGVILRGLPLVSAKAWLQPCLHRESYAYLPEVETIFRQARGVLYNSEGEAALATELYGPGILSKGEVIGEGVESLAVPRGKNSQAKTLGPLKGKSFVLCAGRRDATKNTPFLCVAFRAFKAKYPNSRLQLALIGPGETDHGDPGAGIHDFGQVSETDKAVFFTECAALLNPSLNESYSRVLMEAWLQGKPVAAHGDCLATAMAVTAAGGGWTPASEEDWVECLRLIDMSSERDLAALGKKGRAHAQRYADWETVIDRYIQLLWPKPVAKATSTGRLRAVHQLLPNLTFGDAISNHARAIRRRLRQQGFESEIYARYIDERVWHECKVFGSEPIDPEAGLIYHHSIGSEVTPAAIAHPGPKCLIYHNITPAHFARPFRPRFADILENGRIELAQLAGSFAHSVGDSAYNALELELFGFAKPGVLPIIIEPDCWNVSADSRLMESLQDGRTNVLFVGRIAPNKRQEHLVEAFRHYLALDPSARLWLVGDYDMEDPYYRRVRSTIDRFGLGESAIMTGKVNDAQHAAYFRTAHLFWSMSEHEGFGVPLIESMWYDVPVLAYKSSAVPETLGGAALCFTSKDDMKSIAALARLLVADASMRQVVLQAQRKRRLELLPDKVFAILDKMVGDMEAA